MIYKKKSWLPYNDNIEYELDEFIQRSSIDFTPEESMLTLSSDDEQNDEAEVTVDAENSSDSDDDDYNSNIAIFNDESIQIKTLMMKLKA